MLISSHGQHYLFLLRVVEMNERGLLERMDAPYVRVDVVRVPRDVLAMGALVRGRPAAHVSEVLVHVGLVRVAVVAARTVEVRTLVLAVR